MGAIQTNQRELEAFYAMALPGFLEYLAAHGTSVGSVEMATTLEGITSLPARYQQGGVEKTVLAPLELLTKDVDTQIASCTEATTKANTAADNANTATLRVESAVEDAAEAKQEALNAATEATLAASAADNSREECEKATSDIRTLEASMTEAKIAFDTFAAEATESFGDWTDAEKARQTAEAARALSETARSSTEEERKTSETARAEAEVSRVDAEEARKKAEEGRTTAEAGRTEAESARVTEESHRAEAETLRSEAEVVRQSAETSREEAEDQRATAEEERSAAEAQRLTAETARKEQEASRQRAEEDRVKETTAAIEAAELAAATALKLPYIKEGTWRVYNTAAGTYVDSGVDATGRSPRIVNGTWWTYNDATGEYTDTGQSVSADYQLTKEKIEGVYTGDITTHTHEHLRYAAQVYDEMPDLSSLTAWTDSMGEHSFLAGNDIYVRDATETTGYANYKLAQTTSGLGWVRVPQVAEGWMIVMVKQQNTDSNE